MINQKTTSEILCNLNNLKHLKFELQKEKHMVALVDAKDYEVLKGYGNTRVEALNDLHNNLI